MIIEIIPLILPLVFNFWLWKIYEFSSLLALFVIFGSFSFWLAINSKKTIYFFYSLILMLSLSIIQWRTSAKASFTFLTEQQQLIQIEYARAYPPLGFKLLGHKVWVPAANWLELRPEAVVFYKLKANFSEIVDPNLYFFANHPRERVGVVEYEMFPYIFFPAFITGLFNFRRRHLPLLTLNIFPVFLSSLIGNSHPAGPFAFFPFFTTTIAYGLVIIIPIILKKRLLAISSFILFILIYIQALAYVQH